MMTDSAARFRPGTRVRRAGCTGTVTPDGGGCYICDGTTFGQAAPMVRVAWDASDDGSCEWTPAADIAPAEVPTYAPGDRVRHPLLVGIQTGTITPDEDGCHSGGRTLTASRRRASAWIPVHELRPENDPAPGSEPVSAVDVAEVRVIAEQYSGKQLVLDVAPVRAGVLVRYDSIYGPSPAPALEAAGYTATWLRSGLVLVHSAVDWVAGLDAQIDRLMRMREQLALTEDGDGPDAEKEDRQPTGEPAEQVRRALAGVLGEADWASWDTLIASAGFLVDTLAEVRAERDQSREDLAVQRSITRQDRSTIRHLEQAPTRPEESAGGVW